MRHCKDCEPAQEIHWIAYGSVMVGWFADPYNNFMDRIFKRPVIYLSKKFTVQFLELLVWLKLGHFTDELDAKDSWRTRCFWDEAKRRGIRMREFHSGMMRDVFVAEFEKDGQEDNKKKRKKIMSFDCLPRPGGVEGASLAWMDNKGIMKKKFQKAGLPVAPGGTAMSVRGARKIFNRIEKPVIAKPNLGSRSRHTTIHISTPEALTAAFKKARKLSPVVVIEEELVGSLFRATLISEKVAGVVRRDPPQVEGDGVHTLRALWEAENKRPERANGPLFHPIVFDADAEIELKRQHISMEDIPEKDRIITFSQKTSRGIGGTTTEVTALVHPENKKMLERLGAYLKDPLVGVDFIMTDISQPYTEERHMGIIECNSMPFIDLHCYPLFGPPNNLAAVLWDEVIAKA